MTLTELFIIAVGLSMDAFAVSICKGLSLKKLRFKDALTVGLYFGIFQGGMPLIGYILGVQFQDKITSFDHWIAFILLSIIGFNMIKESREKEPVDANEEVVAEGIAESENANVTLSSDIKNEENPLKFKEMIVLAIATSIDALAIGVTFAFLKVDIVPAVSFIGIVTFVLSMVGVKIGNIFGTKYKSKAELAGGIILIGMGIKILLEHLLG